jgi:hypothetical protein
MPEQRSAPSRRGTVHGHPLRDALLTLIDRESTTTSTRAAQELGESTGACSFHLRQLAALGLIEPVPGVTGRAKPWRRVPAAQASLNRELEDVAYATWLTDKTSDDEDFAFSEVVSLSEGELTELRARLYRVLRDFTRADPTPDTTPTAIIIRAFPMHD